MHQSSVADDEISQAFREGEEKESCAGAETISRRILVGCEYLYLHLIPNGSSPNHLRSSLNHSPRLLLLWMRKVLSMGESCLDLEHSAELD
jgi:hypothetical protein